MSKRVRDDDDDALAPLPLLPHELMVLIGQVLYSGVNSDRRCAYALGSLALCDRALHRRFSGCLRYCAAVEWCVLCAHREGTIRVGCRLGSHCAVYCTLMDRGEESSQSDRLCARCSPQRCGLCLCGHCGCDDDMTCCARCERSICSECRADGDQCFYHEEYDGVLCALCQEEEEEEEEEDDDSQHE